MYYGRKILLVVCIMAAMVCNTAVAAERLETQFVNAAQTMTDEMLAGLNEDDYERFSSNFDPTMKEYFTKQQFLIVSAAIKDKIGRYVSRELVRQEVMDSYRMIIDQAVFSQEDGVIVRTVISEANGKLYIAGFWLDSPKLR